MAYATDRVILFDRNMGPLPELAPSEVLSRVRSEEINAEHELVIVTTRRLEEGWRALTVDGAGRWREWVVTEPDEAHQSGENAVGTYRLVWSLQYDLTASYAHVDAVSVGLGNSMTSQEAAGAILEGVPRWSVGTCDAPDIVDGDGVVLIYESAWSKLSKVVAATGWEVDAEIEVSNLYGVVSRSLCLHDHIGSTDVTRRFDWGEDVSEIKRTPDPGPYYCRVVPLGKGETEYADDDETTFEWPMDITEETGDPALYYIEDAEAAAVFRMPDGNGGWWYPTKVVSYDEDDPELLLAAAQDDLLNHTRPGVSYEATVQQFAAAGLDAHGVALGDDIQIVDRGFNPDAALRLQGRVIKMELDELSPETSTVLSIGSLSPSMTSTFAKSLADLTERQTQIASSVAKLSTAAYVRSLIDRLNQEINATGGYSYIVEGEGIVTYDTAVSDPLVGSEASQVVQIKGGSIRIASSKNAGFAGIDDWDWKTVFTSGHVAAEVVTAAQITAGYIGSASSGNYWNLDTGELRMAATSSAGAANTIGGKSVAEIAGLDAALNQSEILDRLTGGYANEGLFIDNGHLYINGSYMTMGTISSVDGRTYWNLDSGDFHLGKRVGTDSYYRDGAVHYDYVDLGIGSVVVDNNRYYGILIEREHARTSSTGHMLLATDKDRTYLYSGGGLTIKSYINDSQKHYFTDFVDGFEFVHRNGSDKGFSVVENDSQDYVRLRYKAGSSSSDTTIIEVEPSSTNFTSQTVWATNFVNNSDRRLKRHLRYLGDESVDFIRSLHPALYEINGKRRVGFYAQDVRESDAWETDMVEVSGTEIRGIKDALSLDYNELLAPLVAYCQQLEERVERLETMLDEMRREG